MVTKDDIIVAKDGSIVGPEKPGAVRMRTRKHGLAGYLEQEWTRNVYDAEGRFSAETSEWRRVPQIPEDGA